MCSVSESSACYSHSLDVTFVFGFIMGGGACVEAVFLLLPWCQGSNMGLQLRWLGNLAGPLVLLVWFQQC